MEKILFMNSSPNRDGNTSRIGEELLKDKEHDVLQMSDYKIYQYGQVYEDDQIKDVFRKIETADTLVSCSSSDAVNAVVSHIAHNIYHVPNVIARMYDNKKDILRIVLIMFVSATIIGIFLQLF